MKDSAAKVLPPAAVRILQQAAQTPITRDDPLARVRVLDQAIERVKAMYPQFFQKGDFHEDPAQ